MLKFLTHKLRTHSINENNYAEKENEDHDSGTESDDEIDSSGPVMDERICNISPADTGCSMESPAPDNQQDAHSSEEELEVINNTKEERASRPLRSAASLAEKRKWSQIGSDSIPYTTRRCSPENEENMSHYGNLSPCCKYNDDAVHVEHSSDEEVHNLLACLPTPVQFRTSPPLEAVKPGGRTPYNNRSLSPPQKLIHCEVSSPRKRSKHTRHVPVQRPHLDFEKMQSKAKAAVAWKHSGDHGGELSVYCW